MRLIGRETEKHTLHEVLDRVRTGMSAVLVLRGEPGVGKSTLLDYAVEHAADLRVVRTAGIESEMSFGYAAVHHVLMPFLHRREELPAPQRQALGVAFGLAGEALADPYLVGLAALTLLSEAARERPVLCVIDDAQWLDDASADALGFVARRVLADRVGILVAIREPAEKDPWLAAVPEMRIAGLPQPDACELLTMVAGSPVEAGVAQHIAVETGGNPLAIVEAAAELTAEHLRGEIALPEPLPVGQHLEDLFVRRVRDLPADTRTLLVLAAAVHPGEESRLWRAAAALAIPASAAGAAEIAALVRFSPVVRFSHPLVRSAVYHAADPGQRSAVHRALAAACDPQRDAGARAWHLAEAAAGPDEAVAAQLTAAAEDVSSRGRYAAAAALLERAASLRPDEQQQAERGLSA
ncbi:MAG TPA: AAA family ATPase, partial [Actinoplanes sp.]|nr:AAA family ATPase [Actinoplanes sp.]